MTIVPTGAGDVTVTVEANAVQDVSGNPGPPEAVTATALYDADAPGLDINGLPERINSLDTLDVTFTFTEEVTGFATADIAVTNASASALTGSGDSYAMTIVPTGAGDVTVTVEANAVQDVSGNPGPPEAVTATAPLRRRRPGLTIGGLPERINSLDTLDVTFTFTEEVTGFATADIAVTNASASALTGSGDSYAMTIVPTGAGDVTVTAAADAVQDLSGNPAPAYGRHRHGPLRRRRPGLDINGLPERINSLDTLDVTFTFTEDVTGFATADVTVENASASALTGSGDSYAMTIVPPEQAT